MKPPVVFVLTHESNPQRTNKSTSIISLALTRSLGRQGIAVVRVHPNHLDRSLLSRYCKRVEVCPNLHETEDGLVEFLLAMAPRYEGVRVLVPARLPLRRRFGASAGIACTASRSSTGSSPR